MSGGIARQSAWSRQADIEGREFRPSLAAAISPLRPIRFLQIANVEAKQAAIVPGENHVIAQARKSAHNQGAEPAVNGRQWLRCPTVTVSSSVAISCCF